MDKILRKLQNNNDISDEDEINDTTHGQCNVMFKKMALMIIAERQKRKDMQEDIDKMMKKCKFLENFTKQKNLVLYGLKESPKETFDQIMMQLEQILTRYMKIRDMVMTEIDNCYRLGTKANGNIKNGRPLLIKFTTEWRRHQVLKKNSMLEKYRMYLSEDHFKEELERRKLTSETSQTCSKSNSLNSDDSSDDE